MTIARAIALCALLGGCAAQEPMEPAPAALPSPPPPAPVASAPSLPPAPASRVLPDGLEIQELRVGTGDELRPGMKAVVHYVGTLVDGTEFDSSRRRGQPFESRIPGPLIKGWNEGLPGMRVGGLRRLIIPAPLGYGDKGAGGKIPPGATLIFEIELLDVRP